LAASKDFLDNNAAYVANIRTEFPRLDQTTQNPGVLHFTSSEISTEGLLPEITRKPGNVFRVLIPECEDGDARRVDGNDARIAIDQSHYAISHAISGFGKPGSAFERLNRVVIDARTMDAAIDMATRFRNRDWTREWMDLPDRKIFLARIVDGQLIDIDTFYASPLAA
jgi:hypothetical protein